MFPILAAIVALASSSVVIPQVTLISHTFENHLRVVVAPSVAAEKVAIHVTFDAGSRRDEGFPAGTAALSNHIILRRLAGFEGGLNQERAYVSVEVAPEELSKQLRRIAAALDHHVVSSEEFAQSRSDRMLEADKKVNAAYGRSSETLLSLVYRDGRSHDAEVAPASVRKADVEKFLRERYGAASTVVAIAGTFDQDEILKELEQSLSSISGGAAAKPCPTSNDERRSEVRRHYEDRNAAGAEMWLAYKTPPSTEPDWLAMNILADIVGQGDNSRLQRALVASGVATSFGEGMTESPCGPTLFKMRVRLGARDSVSRADAIITQQMVRLRRELVSEEELVLAKQQELEWAKTQLSSASGVASAAARVTLFYGESKRITTESAAMMNVTSEDVRRVAQRYLRSSNRAVVITTGMQ